MPKAWYTLKPQPRTSLQVARHLKVDLSNKKDLLQQLENNLNPYRECSLNYFSHLDFGITEHIASSREVFLSAETHGLAYPPQDTALQLVTAKKGPFRWSWFSSPEIITCLIASILTDSDGKCWVPEVGLCGEKPYIEFRQIGRGERFSKHENWVFATKLQ